MKIDKAREEKRLYLLGIPVFMVCLALREVTDNWKRFLLLLSPIGLQLVIIVVVSIYKFIFNWIPGKIADAIIEKDLKVLINYWRARKERGGSDLPDNL